MERKRFEELVAEALEGLPAEFRDRLENIVVLVEDWPTAAQLREVGVRHRDGLLGLYQGVPLPKRGTAYNMTLPDTIFIFQRPIERYSGTEEATVRKIRDTVRHEIAHYFGISDARLGELEHGIE